MRSRHSEHKIKPPLARAVSLGRGKEHTTKQVATGKKPGVRGESTKQHLQAIVVTHNKEFHPTGES